MAIKTFTSGEVLTAADTNTYLNNGGLVYIGATAFSNAAAASLDNCFSATYNNYKIVLTINTTNGGSDALYFRFRNASGDVTATQYQYSNWESQINTYSATYGAQNNNVGRFGYVYATGDAFGCEVSMMSPYLAEQTMWTFQSSSWDGGAAKVLQTSGGGIYNTNGQFTGISIGTFNGSNATTGRFAVYGYRIA